MKKLTPKESSYLQLLFAVAIIIVILPFVETRSGPLEYFIVTIFFLGLLWSILKIVVTRGLKPKHRWLIWAARALTAVALSADLIEAFLMHFARNVGNPEITAWGTISSSIGPVGAALGVLSLLCYTILIFFLVILIIKDLFSGTKVGMNKIYGAVAIYLLLGLMWTCIYALSSIFHPGSILKVSGNAELKTFGELLYFSFTTLCTLGYGDIIANSRLTMLLTNLEAVTGQLYLAILVARLVGLYTSSSRERKIAELVKRLEK